MKRLERRRVLMRLTSLMLLGCGALMGCDGDADPAPPEVVLDLTTCLGSPDGDGGVSACRSSLQMMAGADGTPAGCFIASDLAGETVRRHAIVWQSDKVQFATAGSLGFLTGQNLSVALFFGDFGACDDSGLTVDTACTADERCRHHLGPVEQLFANSGPTIIDFTRGGACVAESSAAPSAATEPCDGTDNDCDGRIDEDLMEPCTAGRGACQIGGDRLRCDNGVRVCADAAGPILPPASRGPDVEVRRRRPGLR
ncbi:MAG: MopE-related protein [bacterium]